MREDQIRLHLSHQINALLNRDFVIHHHQIALIEAVISPVHDLRSRSIFLRADRGDVPAIVHHRAAVARRHRSDVNLPASFPQTQQRAAAEKLGIIRMSEK